MSAFDKIIGYTSIKEELKQISDILKNREIYDKLGVSAREAFYFTENLALGSL